MHYHIQAVCGQHDQDQEADQPHPSGCADEAEEEVEVEGEVDVTSPLPSALSMKLKLLGENIQSAIHAGRGSIGGSAACSLFNGDWHWGHFHSSWSREDGLETIAVTYTGADDMGDGWAEDVEEVGAGDLAWVLPGGEWAQARVEGCSLQLALVMQLNGLDDLYKVALLRYMFRV
jgi:hypothetical protein